MKKFSIPSGTRDLILQECKAKRELQANIENVFDSFGYEEIITPSIEYYQTYQTGFDQLKDETMYKFIDQEGKILTLRMDMTVPIARVCATKFKDVKPPFRFRYCANVYKVKQSFAGKRNEVSDCGIELIGLDEQSDLEILACAMEVMKTMKQDSYTLEIGNVNFFQSACEHLHLKEDEMQVLADLIDRKSMIELQEYLESLQLEKTYQEFFLQLPWLCGGIECLQAAKPYCFDKRQFDILKQLEALATSLKELGYEAHLTFDLGKVPHLNYYSGLLFEGFVDGVGTSVLSGGRYDHLLEKFGAALPAIGFSVKLDYMIDAYQCIQDEKKTILLVYHPQDQLRAFQRAATLREQYKVILRPDDKCVDMMEVTQ